MVKDYAQALDWIMSFWDPTRPKELERALRPLKVRRLRELLERLGSPHLRYPSILVAGTKGKGSTCAFLADGLRAAGYRVGRYTQPHLIDWRERTWVDGELIGPDEVAALVERIRPAVDEMHASAQAGGLTTYEVGTALTLCYFAERGVDVAVLEIGVGGRLDALNVVDPVLSVLTSISLDHTDVLGETLEEIAAEKAGIMRAGVPALSGPQQPEAEGALARAASEIGAELRFVGRDWRWEPGREPGTIDVRGPDGTVRDIKVPLVGDHQRDNAALAVAALQTLGMDGFAVDEGALRRGFEGVQWPGRVQILRRSPAVVVDAAHNADSARRLLETVRREFRFRRLTLVFGASAEKDLAGMAGILGPAASTVIVTSSGHRRAADMGALAVQFEPYAPVEQEAEPEAAFSRALGVAGADDLVLITGSVFLAGRAIEVMSNE